MRILVISDVITFLPASISRFLRGYMFEEENWMEFGRIVETMIDTKDPHESFHPSTPSRLVAPIDLVLSVLIFCLPFLRFSSYYTHWSQECWFNFDEQNLFFHQKKNRNSFFAFFLIDSPFLRPKWKLEIDQHPCIAGQRENDTHHHVLTIGVVTWALIDNVTSGASHLTCLRGGRERYYEATSTKPLHWQAS